MYVSKEPPPAKLVEKPNESGQPAEYWQSRSEPGSRGGSLRISEFGAGPKTFNYWAHTDATSAGYGLLMFERLLDIDPWTGKFTPRLLKSFTESPDHMEYTLTLRKGLVWSDGHPLNADDMIFTFNTIVAKGYGNTSNRDVLSVEGHYPTFTKVDDLTVKARTFKPFAPFINSLRSVPIAPKHVMEAITKRPMADFHTYWSSNVDPKTMVVSGPFKLGRYVPSQRVEMVRNDKFHMVDSAGNQLPYLDKFVATIVPEQGTQRLKFEGHEIDFLDVRSVRGVDVAQLAQMQERENFKMYNLGPDDGTTFLMFNMCRRKNPKTGKFYVDPIKQKWFNDLNFRQAMSHAVNRDRIVNNVLKGVGMPLYTAESTASLWFNKSLKPYGQDLNLARQLLEKSGFKKKDDGRLYDSEGHPIEFTLLTNAGNSSRDGTCISIKDELGKLGIKVNYQPIDFNILIDKTNTSLDWEAVMMGLTGGKIEPYDGANVWKTDGRLHMFDQRIPDEKTGVTTVTDARDWEKELDKVFDMGATTFGEARRKWFDRYQEIVYEQQPYIYLYSILDVTAARNTIGNYAPTPLAIDYPPKGSLHNVEELYMKKAAH